MSEYRKGRKRFISRDPSKANNNNQWKEEYNGRVITTGAASTTVASTSKNAANNYLHQPTFDLRTSDPATSDLYSGSSPSSTRLSSLKQLRSTRHTSSPSSTSLRSEYHSTSRPSGDDRQNNDVLRSRDRSALRVVTVDAKTRIGADRRMASEMGFRPILRRHGTSSSSSGCESPYLKDNGIITSASSKTSLCPVVTIPDLRLAPATSIPTISAMTQRTESGTQKSQTHPGTFLTLPANADSMQVQIKDTRISITRVPDQVPGATTRLRTLSAEYDNVPEPSASSSASTKQVVSIPQSVPPAFAPSYESPGKLSPVRGLRLVPSPNSAFTKTKTSKASANTDVQFQSEYSDWTMPALSLGTSRGPLELDQRSANASLTGQPNTTTVFDQTPIDFSLIFSGIGLRPLDLEYPVPEKQRTFRALKSCSMESIAVADVESGKTSGRTNRVSANESSIGNTVTNRNDAPPISKTTSQSSAFVSQTSSRDSQSKPKRILTEAEIRPQKNYSTSKPITDVFAIIGQHPSVVQQPIRNSVAKPSSSLALEALIDPFTKFSKTDLQPIMTDGPTNLFTSTVVQPITNSKQHYLSGSVGPITSSSKADQPINCSVTSTRSVTGPASRPITISTTSFGKVNVSTYILPPSLESTTSTAPLHFPLPLPYAPGMAEDEEVLAEPTMASAMSSLEMAISMLNSVAMDTSAPGVAMTILSTIATDTESLAKSFQLEAGAVGTDPIDYHEKPSDGREVVLPPPPPHALAVDGRPDSLRSGSTTDVVVAAPPRETFEYPVREDAVLTLTLNLLDQTLAEIHQEFPPGRRPSAGKTPRTEVTSSTTTAPTSHPALSRLPETTSSSKTMPWDSSPPAQPRNSTTVPDVHRDAFGSRMTAEINDPDRYLRRILDRQDSFNRPGSSLFPETLPLPKDSVLQRYRRKKKTKSSASSSSSSSSSSTSSSSRDEGEGNGAAGAKRSPRIGRRQTRRQRMNIRSEDGAAAAAAGSAGGESKTKTRTSQRRRRAEERSDGEKDRQTYKQPGIQVAKGITNALSNNLDLVAAAEPITSGQSIVAETWLTLAAAGPSQVPLQVFDSVYPSSSKKLSHEIPEHSACIVTPSDALESQVQSGVTPNMIGTIYANSVSDSERTGKSTVHRSFRNLGRSVDGDGDSVDLTSGVSPRGMQHCTSASSPSNQRSLASRSHSSGSCSPADTSTRAKNLTPFSRRERRIGENRSPATEERQQHQQVVNEHNRSQHQHHHLSSSSDRLYATASADEEVFLARVPQSASPSQKLSDDASQSGVGPSRIRIRSKESLSSGAHGCDHRTGVESPLNPERVHSDSDRGAGGVGPRVESSSFTGSVRLTLKQRSEDLTDDGGGPQKIRTLSTRTNSSTDEFPGVIRAQSKAVSYESICLKIKEDAAEKNPKTIQVISLSQPPKLVSASKAVLLEESQTNRSPKDGRNPPCSASQVCDVQFRDAGISSRPVQRDHSTKHRSNVFFSSKKSASGSHTDLSQMETVHLLPVQMSKVSSLPAKLIKRNVGAVNLKSDLGQSSKISELHDNNKPGKVITVNKKSHDVTLHTSSQTFTKSEDRQKATIIVNAEHGATSDKRLSKMGSTEQPPSHFELSPNRLGKESKFFLRCDQQPRTTDQVIMGTVFTDRHTPRQNLLFPGTDFTPRDNSNSGRTSDTKASQNSKSVPQVSAYKIIKQNSRPFVEESKVSVVPENKGGGVLVREAPISTQVAPIFSKDSGGRIKIIPPVATASKDNNKFSSSFLCSLSKFSQPPAEGISICTTRQKPLSVSSSSSSSSLSRVGWAKQRLGQDPENKTTVSQLKTSLKDSATTGTQKSGSALQQMHNTDATVISTFKQDRVSSVDGKHTIVFARRGLPSAGEIQLSSSAGGEPLQLPVTTQDVVTVSPSPLVLGPAKLTTSSALLPGLQFTASKKLSQASVPLVSERQNPTATGSLPNSSFKVFIQSPHQAAVLKRSSLLVPYLSAPLSDAENSLSSISQDSVNSKDIGLIELEVLCHGEAESADSLRELDSDSTGLMDATSSSPVGVEDTVVRAFVRKPQLADDCTLVQQILPTVIVEPCLPGDNQVFVYPIENIVCQEEHLLPDTITPDGTSQSTQAGASSSKSEPSFTGKACKFGVQATQDSLQGICFNNERSVVETSEESRDPLKIEKSLADPMTRTFNPDSFLKASTTSENSQSEREVSPNDEVHELSLSETHSSDSRIQEPGHGLCSKVSEAPIDAAVHDINDQLSQLDRNPESFEPSSTSEMTNRAVVASGNDDYHVEVTSKSATGAIRTQGPSSQMQPTMDIVSEGEVSTTRGLAMTEDKREDSTGIDGSLVVSTKDAMVGNVLSEDKRVERAEHSVKPEVRVVRGGLARTRSIPSLEIIEENSTSSTTTTTLSSSTNPTSSTKVTTSSRPIISAKEAQNTERVSHDDHVSNYTGDAGNLVQAFPKNDVQKETMVDSKRLPLLKMAKTDSGMVGSKKKTVEKEKARRVVRFVSQDEMLEYSPTEFRDSSTPSDLLDKKHCSPLYPTESDALSASMEPAARRFTDAPFIGDSPLKSPRKNPETFEDFLLKSPRKDSEALENFLLKSPKKDSETLEDFLLKSPMKDSETLEDFLLKSPKKDSETFEDFLLKSPRKEPETSRDDASKSSPSAGKTTTTTTTTTTTKPCIVRKQLIHLDSALHPSSCVPPDSTPVEARWSPKLVRKLNLAEAKDVDVSDLDVAPELMDFLSKEMEKVSVDMKQPDHGETKDELETGTQGIASLSRQRKPPLSLPLPLKSSEREEEEDAWPSSASAVDIDAVRTEPEVGKTEPEVGKRKFFSALKANAASFRAKKVLPSADDPSPDPKSNLDRLASFAIISDVGIGAKRRQFQRHKEASLTSISSSSIITEAPSTDAHAKQPTLESPPSATDRIPSKQASFPVSAASGADADKTKTRLVIDDESETRFGTAKGETKARLGSAKARLGKPEVDSDDDDFDRLVEINIRELVDETGSARDGPESMEQRMGAKNQTGTGIAGTSGTAGTVGGQEKGQGGRRQLSRFKTQPVTNVEVEKAREMALHPKTNSEN